MHNVIAFLVSSLLLFGCAATQIALEKKNLEVQTRMSDTIFLDVEQQPGRDIFVNIRNTTDKNIKVEQRVKDMLIKKGYSLSADPKAASYILQVNILQVGKANPAALRAAAMGGYGTVLGAGAIGGVGGYALGSALGSNTTALGLGALGVLAGAGTEMVSGSLVKDVSYAIITDVMISERTSEKVKEKQTASMSRAKSTRIVQEIDKKTDRQRYQTRITSYANKVNLEFEEALPQLEDGLVRAISGIF